MGNWPRSSSDCFVSSAPVQSYWPCIRPSCISKRWIRSSTRPWLNVSCPKRSWCRKDRSTRQHSRRSFTPWWWSTPASRCICLMLMGPSWIIRPLLQRSNGSGSLSSRWSGFCREPKTFPFLATIQGTSLAERYFQRFPFFPSLAPPRAICTSFWAGRNSTLWRKCWKAVIFSAWARGLWWPHCCLLSWPASSLSGSWLDGSECLPWRWRPLSEAIFLNEKSCRIGPTFNARPPSEEMK